NAKAVKSTPAGFRFRASFVIRLAREIIVHDRRPSNPNRYPLVTAEKLLKHLPSISFGGHGYPPSIPKGLRPPAQGVNRLGKGERFNPGKGHPRAVFNSEGVAPSTSSYKTSLFRLTNFPWRIFSLLL